MLSLAAATRWTDGAEAPPAPGLLAVVARVNPSSRRVTRLGRAYGTLDG